MKNKPLSRFKGLGIGLLVLAPVIAFGAIVIPMQKADMQFYKFARSLWCTCDMKCSLKLLECDCAMKGGAQERKDFIKKVLKDQRNDSKAMEMYVKKYGA